MPRAVPFAALTTLVAAATFAVPLRVAPVAAASPVDGPATVAGPRAGAAPAAAIPVRPASQPAPSGGPSIAALRTFVAHHHAASRAGRATAAAAAAASARVAGANGVSAAATACYGTAHTQAGPDNGATQLIVSSFGLFYDCNFDAWELDLTTQDTWTNADLGAVIVVLDTDSNSANGCNGFDRAVIGVNDPTNGLVAQAVVTPSCDENTWLVADDDFLAHPSPTQLALDFTQEDIGNPPVFRWAGSLQGTSEATPDRFPPTGTLTETGYPTVPANNACPPGLINGLSARMAVLSDPAAAGAAAAAIRGAGLGSVSADPGGVLRFTGDPAAAVSALDRAGIGAQVSTDRVAHYADVPNDPDYPQQWNLTSIQMQPAWDITHGSPSVTVADIDTGVDATHPDLQGKLATGYDVTKGAPLGAGLTDSDGHGTAVAGVIAAATNNNLGLAGVGWDTTVAPVKVSTSDNDLTTAAVVSGINWAVGDGIRVINLSLGTCGEPTLAAAVQQAEDRGVLLVAAAGNQYLAGNAIQYPGGYPGVIAVGALAHDGTRAMYSETGHQVALVAPGGSADGTAADDIPLLKAGGGFTAEAGTSFASPEVAGVAALILAANPTLTPADAGALETATATKVGSSPDVNYGAGELDAAAALTAASKIKRTAGSDRYGTAAALSRLAFPAGSPTVYVASGETFADALPTGAFAGKQSGPILLTSACALPAATTAELTRLKPTNVYVIGGALAVCDAVVTAITQATGVTPTRISGADRYATSAALAGHGWPTTSPIVYVTTGVNFPDGLTGTARAALDGAPLLLTATCSLPAATAVVLRRLAPTTIKLIGGQAAICPAVQTAIAAEVPGAQIVRIQGSDRIDTGVQVVQDGWKQVASVIVANAANFPDALSAGAFAAATKSPLLINDSCTADPEVAAEVRSLAATSMTVVGGPPRCAVRSWPHWRPPCTSGVIGPSAHAFR